MVTSVVGKIVLVIWIIDSPFVRPDLDYIQPSAVIYEALGISQSIKGTHIMHDFDRNDKSSLV